MTRLKIGILGTADIAFRRFMPALMDGGAFDFAGIASRTPEKAEAFTERYPGRVYDSYDALIADKDIDAVYIPLPPALHAEWCEKALLNGKHVFMEKPFSTSKADTQKLIALAARENLVLHENYMFLYHSQLDWIINAVKDGQIGELRLIRTAFGFPFRGVTDFRYNKALGGGALLDCGGYTLKLASMLLGNTAKITTSRLNRSKEFEVDIYGSATMENEQGAVAQLSFGMDNSYKCELEIWGSSGCISTNRIYTAPRGFEPIVTLAVGDDIQKIQLPSDDSFSNSIHVFSKFINSTGGFAAYQQISNQAVLIEQVFERDLTE